jgi:hypothetical protein
VHTQTISVPVACPRLSAICLFGDSIAVMVLMIQLRSSFEIRREEDSHFKRNEEKRREEKRTQKEEM